MGVGLLVVGFCCCFVLFSFLFFPSLLICKGIVPGCGQPMVRLPSGLGVVPFFNPARIEVVYYLLLLLFSLSFAPF